jgi:hypothetical protein
MFGGLFYSQEYWQLLNINNILNHASLTIIREQTKNCLGTGARNMINLMSKLAQLYWNVFVVNQNEIFRPLRTIVNASLSFENVI